jgi:peptidyl-prolyl cis-trans isomerase B (cyclophilin B)
MSNKRARERQLAKLAARRQQERRRARRRRAVGLGLVAGAIAIGAAVAVLSALGDDGGAVGASPTPTPTGASPSPTGTVEPGTAPDEVACDARAPASATEPKPQFTAPPPLTIDQKATYTATLVTSCGEIRVRLLARSAPHTVNSFVFLARAGFFDGTFFHRLVDSIDVIQGGDPTGTGGGGPGYTLPDELQGDETYGPGTVAMANAGANTGGSQFFVITGPDGHNLDGNPAYTIFGRVISGLGVAREINALLPEGTDDGAPPVAVYIETVRIRERPAEPAAPTGATGPTGG